MDILPGLLQRHLDEQRRARLFWLRLFAIVALVVFFMLAAFGEIPEVSEYVP